MTERGLEGRPVISSHLIRSGDFIARFGGAEIAPPPKGFGCCYPIWLKGFMVHSLPTLEGVVIKAVLTGFMGPPPQI